MERDNGLASARPALDDGDLGEGAPHNRILIGGDRRDDVAHPAFAGRLDRRSCCVSV